MVRRSLGTARRPALPRAPASAVLAAAVVALLAGFSAPAQAHAVLLDTSPRDGEVVLDDVGEVELRFSEPVEVPPAGIRLHDARAEQLAQGAGSLADDGATVRFDLPENLDDDGYVVTWRVVSADGHLLSGAFTFTVGEGAPVTDEVVADLFGGGDERVLGTVGSVLRGLGYAGTLVAAGAAVFAMAIASSGDDRSRARRIALRGAAAGAAATVLAVPVQAMAVAGVGLVEALRPGDGLGPVLTSSFGHGSAVRLAGLVTLVAGWRRGGTTSRWLLAPAAVAAASFAVDGHQRTAEPPWLVASADVVHLLAGAVWFGGLALVAVALRQRRLDDDPVGGARLVARFSRVAQWAVMAVSAAGVAMAWALVRAPRGLFVTTYGRLLVAKLVLVALVVAVGAYNRRRLVPAVAERLTGAGGSVDASPDHLAAVEHRSRAAWQQLRHTVRFEVAGILLVLAVTGFLVVERPAADQLGVTGAYQTTVAFTDDLDLDLVVDPNRVGRNAIHVFVLDATGRPAGHVEELRLELTYLREGIGPFTVEPFVAGPGHWVANVDELRFAGMWEIRITAAVDRFEEASTELSVEVQR